MAGIVPNVSNRTLVVMFLVSLATIAIVQRNIMGIGSFISGGTATMKAA